mgnify:CR=1 FL=1
MSVWTHVVSDFIVKDFKRLTDEKIYNIIGREGEPGERDASIKYLPMGSEGSLKADITRFKDRLLISVFGDLRSYENFDEIKSWFNECCKSLKVEQAFCKADCYPVYIHLEHPKPESAESMRINASFRIDGLRPLNQEVIKERLYRNMPFSSNKLNLNIWNNPDKKCLAVTTITLFGEIEDNTGIIDIRDWFREVCSEFCIRQAFCQINGNGVADYITPIMYGRHYYY